MIDIVHNMSVQAPALLPIFRSALQAQILLQVFTLSPGCTSAELARLLAEPEPSVSREVRRLLACGLLRGVPIGRAVQLFPDEGNPAVAPLRQLLIVTFAPAPLLAEALKNIDQIDSAYIHGSWAARFMGEVGSPPGDIDLIIIGSPDRARVDQAIDAAEVQLTREINVSYVTPTRWNDTTDPFVATIRSRPLVSLAPDGKTGSEHDRGDQTQLETSAGGT